MAQYDLQAVHTIYARVHRTQHVAEASVLSSKLPDPFTNVVMLLNEHRYVDF